jgi:hypothetical protein
MAGTILKRNLPGNNSNDLGSIGLNEYNNYSGAQKVTEVGRNLLPLVTPGTGTGYTVTPTTAFPLGFAGLNFAVYNPTGTVGAITFGTDNTVTALAAGTTDSSGRVGLPCTPNSWSYFASGYSNWIIAGAGMLVFLINDDTNIQAVAATFNSTPVTNPI